MKEALKTSTWLSGGGRRWCLIEKKIGHYHSTGKLGQGYNWNTKKIYFCSIYF